MSDGKILYDHQIFSFQSYGGISRYYHELMTRAGDRVIMPSIYSNNHYIKNTPYRKDNPVIGRALSSGLLGPVNRVGEAVGYNFPYSHNRHASTDMLLKGGFGVFHPTYYDPYFLDHIGKRPFVITVHDMIHEIYPEYFSLGDRVSAWKRAVIPKAARVIAISECTKRDIRAFFDLDDDAIEVIYHGNSLGTGRAGAAADGAAIDRPPGDYLLFVGDRKAYKNFYFFIESVADILIKEGLRVVCSGGGPFKMQELLFLKRLNVGDRVSQCSVSDDLLAGLYEKALAFVYPSLYEGFGIPVVEAFACGCPAVLSDRSSLPEVGGDSALYFNPKDTMSLRKAVERVIHEDGLRGRLRAKGFERAKQFTWEKTAAKTFALYDNLS